ncbi:MAG TPA: AGE family epimerase/isomerase, partial [Gemmatimonadota bacterium]|nr:AGE family epimerase/isomerase [Gemmatimonadota bacterium]
HGDVFYGFRDDWSVLPQPERFGYAFQAIERLISAAPAISRGHRLRERAFQIGEHAFRHAARNDGGFVFFGAIGAPERLEGARLVGRRRVWWVQLAALNALAIFATAPREDREEYVDRLRRHWKFLQDRQIDSEYGGFHPVVPQDLQRRGRLRRAMGDSPEVAKGTVWKDASHEVDSLLGTLRLLSPPPEARVVSSEPEPHSTVSS